MLLRMLALRLAMAAILVSSFAQVVRPVALAAYNCVNPHCYSYLQWTGAYPGAVWGSATTIGPTQNVIAGTSGLISNEMWLLAPWPSGVPARNFCLVGNAGLGTCWVESGLAGDTLTVNNPCSPAAQCYFWADLRPCPVQVINGIAYCQGTNITSNYFVHYVSNYPQGDMGNAFETLIYGGTGFGTTGTYAIETLTPHGTYYNFSNGNYMTPRDIRVGIEFGGASGTNQYMPYTYFYYNEYLDSGGGIWHYQTTNGNPPYVNNPPLNGYWAEPPSAGVVSGGEYAAGCNYYPCN